MYIFTSHFKFIYFTVVIYIDQICGLYTPQVWSEKLIKILNKVIWNMIINPKLSIIFFV